MSQIGRIGIESKNRIRSVIYIKSYSSDLPKIEKFVKFEGKTLLEIGCGDGRLTARLAGKAAAITAIGPDEISMEAAERNVNGVNFLMGSGEKLDFADEKALYVYFMENYMTEPDDCAVEKMQAILGDNQTNTPIIVQDMVNIFLLGT